MVIPSMGERHGQRIGTGRIARGAAAWGGIEIWYGIDLVRR